jgi:simple sugar transport system ATP-binding protein/D-xylose transport system ATP-binding protein
VVSERSPVLEARGLSKAFGHVQALREVSFELSPAEVVALVGDNGAGKSTLIKILAGVHRPDVGELHLDGEPVEIKTPSEAVASGIATVYQDLALVDTLDVARNIYLGGVPKRFGFLIDYPKMYDDAVGVLQSLAIRLGSVRTKVGDLSGGQRQAVAIARALAHEARVVLMDEPTAALGVEQQGKVNDLIGNLQGQGKTVVVISHNLEHLFGVADRFLVLRHGRCVGDRPVAETTREEIVGLITGAIERVEQ